MHGELLSSALQRVPGVERLYVLPSGPIPPNPSELLATERCHEVLASLQADDTLVIVDTPPVLTVTDAAALAPSAGGILIVAAARVDPPEAGAPGARGLPSDLGARSSASCSTAPTAPRPRATAKAPAAASGGRRAVAARSSRPRRAPKSADPTARSAGPQRLDHRRDHRAPLVERVLALDPRAEADHRDRRARPGGRQRPR